MSSFVDIFTYIYNDGNFNKLSYSIRYNNIRDVLNEYILEIFLNTFKRFKDYDITPDYINALIKISEYNKNERCFDCYLKILNKILNGESVLNEISQLCDEFNSLNFLNMIDFQQIHFKWIMTQLFLNSQTIIKNLIMFIRENYIFSLKDDKFFIHKADYIGEFF